ncbi:hypothetical protein Bca101_027856 [Brassica carinata]
MERGLLELHLHAYAYVILKRELLTSNTLVKLTLSGGCYLEVDRVYFPVLKSLSLLFLEIAYPDYHRFLDGCPVLEELFIVDDDHSNPPCCGAVVKSESIKRLVVFIDLPDSQEDHNSMLLDTPSLMTLHLSADSLEGLVHRETKMCGDACGCIPIKHKEEEEVCCLWKCQVKVLEISDYKGSSQELKQMRHFLGKLKCLESVKVRVDAEEDDNDNSELLRDNLLNLPRISSKCNVQFI